MKIIFFGNTTFSLIGAKIIHQTLGLSTIVTIPDATDSRGKVKKSLLKEFGEASAIPVLTTKKIDEVLIEKIAALQPDFFVVEDYGLILPQKLLTIPKYAPLNVHHSLLPKYRGPAPAPYAILAGEHVSGVSVIHMAGKVDAGDIYAQTEYILKPNETTVSLLTVLNELGGNLVVRVISEIVQGSAKRQIQAEKDVIMTNYMKKTDGCINLQNPPQKEQIDRMIRAYYPWPTVWVKTEIQNKEVRIKFLPGKIIQMEGKKPVSRKDFLNGYPAIAETINKII